MTELPMPTKEAVIDRREERFMARLLAALANNASKRDRALVTRLADESPFTLGEIAAAAISMARGSEKEIALPAAPEPAHVDSREFSPKKKGYPRSKAVRCPAQFQKERTPQGPAPRRRHGAPAVEPGQH